MSELYERALDLDADGRRSLLAAERERAPELVREVESLLAAGAQAAGFLEAGAVDATGWLDEPAAAIPLQSRVGAYRLLEEIGHGGMGTVYLAERADGAFDQQVALKLVRRSLVSEALRSRFLRERRILARLEHPNIAHLIDGGVADDGSPFLAMELVRGESLGDFCTLRRLGVERRVELFEQACRAVQHAHSELVVHRDLKPANILVTDGGVVKLLDFGIARLLEDETDSPALTRTGLAPHTPAYAAPEQLRGERATTLTDIYSLGVLLHEVLSGCRPPAEGSSRERGSRGSRSMVAALEQTSSLDAVAASASSTPRELRRALSGELGAIVAQALESDPRRRYASAEAFAEDLARWRRGQPVRALPATWRYRFAKFVGRHRLAAASLAVASAALFTGFAGSIWQARVASRERDVARQEARRAEEIQRFLERLFEGSDPYRGGGDEVPARELLERGIGRIDRELAGQPLVQAELLATLAGIELRLGRYDRAGELASRGLRIVRGAELSGQPVRVRLLDLLGNAAVSRGEPGKAQAPYREALALLELLPGDRELARAEILNDLAIVRYEEADFPAAEAMHREALEIRRRRLGGVHADVADSLGNLALVVRRRGDAAAAEELEREALELRRALFSDDHPEVAYSMATLAAVVRSRGGYAEAESLYRRALEIERRHLPADHPRISTHLNNLAKVLLDRGDHAEAEVLLREVLERDRGSLGEEHPFVAYSLDNLAVSVAAQGRLEEALRLFRRALAIHEKANGADHPSAAASRLRQAGALREAGRLGEALRLAGEAIAACRRASSSEEVGLAAALAERGRLRTLQGRAAAGGEDLEAALVLQRRAYPAGHLEIGWTLVGWGQALAAGGQRERAEKALVEGRSILESAVGSEDRRTVAASAALRDLRAAG
ncbi:MAG: tetratricopeptide repeat protein [Thermoanaerobaculia bacterium]